MPPLDPRPMHRFLFDPAQARRLLGAAAALADNLQALARSRNSVSCITRAAGGLPKA